MRCELTGGEPEANNGKIVTGIQTHALRVMWRGLWSLNLNTVERGFDQHHILSIGAVNHQRDWNTMPFSQEAAFHPLFTPVRRVPARFFPHPAVPLSSPHPC